MIAAAKRKVEPVKATFNLSGWSAEHAQELAYVNGHKSVSRYVEALIDAAYKKRQRSMVPVKLVVRKRQT